MSLPATVAFVGRLHDGAQYAARLHELGLRGLPPYPDTTVIPAVRIPKPPLLDPACSEVEWVQNLAAGYRGAIWSFYRKRSWFMSRPRKLAQHKSFGALSEFADRLHLAEVSPASWALFSMESWRFMSITKNPPKLSWVFSPKRLVSQMEWFDDETNRWTGGRVKYAERHLELLVRWQRMWRELLCKRPTGRLSLLAIVDKHFPGNAYEAAVDLACGESRRMQLDVDERIAQGEIVWTA